MQIHSGKLAGPSWMIRFTKNSGLKIENHTAFPPDEKVIIDRKIYLINSTTLLLKLTYLKKSMDLLRCGLMAKNNLIIKVLLDKAQL